MLIDLTEYKYLDYSVVEEMVTQRGKGTNLWSHSQEVLVLLSKPYTLSAPCLDGSFLGADYWLVHLSSSVGSTGIE